MNYFPPYFIQLSLKSYKPKIEIFLSGCTILNKDNTEYNVTLPDVCSVVVASVGED